MNFNARPAINIAVIYIDGHIKCCLHGGKQAQEPLAISYDLYTNSESDLSQQAKRV